MNYFLEIYGTLPRAGPGSDALTRKAFELLGPLPGSPRILDLGCGPGVQTLELLRLSAGSVVAMDLLPEMTDRLSRAAHGAGVAERLEVRVEDMNAMSFPPNSFDIIWSEAAIYNMGFENGLQQLQTFLKPGGFVVVSDAVWTKADPPPEVADFWREYPEMDTVENKLDVIKRVGFEPVGHFLFPSGAWTEQYYDPMEARIAAKAKEWQGNAEAEAVLAEARKEISLFRRFSDYFNYAFFVMRL
ncbi:MAG: class I SAM-dependent methyltransferase [Halieaceae bacterium]